MSRLNSKSRATEPFAMKQAAADKAWTMARLNTTEKGEFQNLTSERDRNRFMQHKFLEKQNQNYKRFFFERGIGAAAGGGMGFMNRHAYDRDGVLNRATGGLWSGMRNPESWTLANMLFSTREGNLKDNYTYGRFFHKDNSLKFRALDGQLAGATFGDKALDKALSMGNTTHTSNWDELSPEQRENIKRKIESQMSSSDALNYAKMSREEQNEFVQSFYATDPEEFAPGVGKDGVNKMVEYLKNADKLQNNKDELYAASKMMGLMTRQEKAEATKMFLAWSKNNGGGGIKDPGIMMGNLAGAAMADKALDKALGATDLDKMGRAMSEMSREQREAYYKLDKDQQDAVIQRKYTQALMRDQMNKGHLDSDKFYAMEKTIDTELAMHGIGDMAIARGLDKMTGNDGPSKLDENEKFRVQVDRDGNEVAWGASEPSVGRLDNKQRSEDFERSENAKREVYSAGDTVGQGWQATQSNPVYRGMLTDFGHDIHVAREKWQSGELAHDIYERVKETRVGMMKDVIKYAEQANNGIPDTGKDPNKEYYNFDQYGKAKQVMTGDELAAFNKQDLTGRSEMVRIKFGEFVDRVAMVQSDNTTEERLRENTKRLADTINRNREELASKFGVEYKKDGDDKSKT